VPPRRQARIKVGKKGDSVAALARRYRMQPDQLAQLNGVAVGARFKPGQTVTVLVSSKGTRVATKAAPAKRLTKPAATARQRKPAN
jgi:membrane-bound lytic murein transglycosylase D